MGTGSFIGNYKSKKRKRMLEIAEDEIAYNKKED